MRRALLAAAAALPAAALAVQTASSGKVIEVNDYNVTLATSYLNAAACASGGLASLEWNIVPLAGTFSPTGTYLIFASDTAPPTTGTDAFFCRADAPSANPAVHSGQVGSAAVSTSIQDLAVSGAAIGAAASRTCNSTNEGQTVYVCAHQMNGSTKLGYASGTFQIQVLAPGAPTVTSVGPGDGQLDVSFTAPASGPAAVDHYAARATPQGATSPEFWSSTTTGTTATISGLTNNTPYDIVVFAYSVGGNPTQSTNSMVGTPLPSADFWEFYKAQGGVEKGGCGTAGAGAPALLGALALAALRRRGR